VGFSGLITYAHTYVTVILCSIDRRLSVASNTTAIIRKTESEERSSFVPRSGGVVE
jgi:hypothetical protein